MKSGVFLVLLSVVLAVGGGDARALQAASRDYAAEMSVDADVQADFYKRYPDLRDEEDVVTSAARALAAERARGRNDAETAEMLAKRARSILAARSPAEWQAKAVQLYPELGVAGSKFNTLFLRHFNELKSTSPHFTEEPSWPVLLARRCADELNPKPAALAPAKPTATGVPSTSATAPAATKRTAWWAAALSFLVLLAIVVQPARMLWKLRHAFAGGDGPLTLWQAAMGPTAGAYLLVSVVGLVQTFASNADQRLFDRSGIALLVSLVAGAVAAIPAYGVSLVGMGWWRNRKRAAPHSVERSPAPQPELTTSGRKS